MNIKIIGKGESHAKIILGGEHSVVHEKPAIVLPVPLIVKASTSLLEKSENIEKNIITIYSRIYQGTSTNPPKQLKGYFHMVRLIQKQLGIVKHQRGIHIDVESDIPIGTGLGSSAAVANAIARSVYDFYNHVINEKELYTIVELAETYAHGNPSGLDMLGTSLSQPIQFLKSSSYTKCKVENLWPKKPLTFLIFLSGKSIETKEVVEKVGMFFKDFPEKKEPLLHSFEEIVESMKLYFQEGDGDGLGESMNQNHVLLQQLGVSSNMLDKLVKVALKNGALGAKLTGKGIGGAIIALVKDKENGQRIGEALLNIRLKQENLSMDGSDLNEIRCYVYHLNEGASIAEIKLPVESGINYG